MRQSSSTNPYEGAEESEPESVSMSTVEATNRAEIDVQVATAKRFPRSMARFRKRVFELATLDEDTARSCFYAVPRGGKTIEGPSVRMAEIVAACYGNLRIASRIVPDERRGLVTVEAIAIDLEANYAVKAEVVQRVVGRPDQYEDMSNLAAMSAQAKARRNAVFGVVPGSEIKAIMGAVRKVAVGDAKTLADRRAHVLAVLAKMGATKNRVLARLELESENDITVDHILFLGNAADEIHEGKSTVDGIFPLGTANPAVKATGAAPASKLDAVKAKAEAQAQPKASEPAEKAAQVDAAASEGAATEAQYEGLLALYAAGLKEADRIKTGDESARVTLEKFARARCKLDLPNEMKPVGERSMDSDTATMLKASLTVLVEKLQKTKAPEAPKS